MVKKLQEQETQYQPIQPEFNVFNRKKMRKEKKLKKKQQHMQINQNRNFKNQGIQIQEPQKIDNQIEKKSEKKLQQIRQPKQQDHKFQQLQKEIEQEDQIIEKLSKKLKLKSNRLTKQQMLEDGMEDDLFDFLDHIDATIKENNAQNYSAYKQQQKQQLEEEENEIDEEVNDDSNGDEDEEIDQNEELDEIEEDDDNFDEEDDDEEDNLNEDEDEDEKDEQDQNEDDDEGQDQVDQDDVDEDDEDDDDVDDDDADDDDADDDDVDDDEIEPDQSEEFEEQEQQEEMKITIDAQQKNNQITKKPIEVANEEPKVSEIQYNEQQILEIRKLLNRNLNKLSEANINNITDEITKIFEQYPKQMVGQAFGQQLILSTVKPIELLPYLLSCIVSSACYFHQIYDNLFFGELIKSIILKLKSNPEAHEIKNITLVFCHWYLLESISLQFIKEYIKFLLTKENNVEHLLLLIQYCGKKIRQDNPAILKQIIDDIKNTYSEITESRTKFLLYTLDDLRLNKKIASQAERLEFLINWHKQRTQKMIHRIFCQGFQFSYESSFENNNWWKPIVSNQEQTQLYQEFKQQKKNVNLDQLEQLAIEQKMVTETRKTAFTIIMGADDLFEATQNLDKLGFLRKKKQDVCLVIVEMCGNEKTYNPYYQELANYLINFEKGMKQAFQYMLWDKFKLLENYATRKQINIAKFCANLLKKESINITVLKWFNFDEITEIQAQFLCIVIQNYLQNLQIEVLAKQCKNLFENPDYLPFRNGLQQFLKDRFKDFIDQQPKQNNDLKRDLKIMIRLLKEEVNQ